MKKRFLSKLLVLSIVFSIVGTNVSVKADGEISQGKSITTTSTGQYATGLEISSTDQQALEQNAVKLTDNSIQSTNSAAFYAASSGSSLSLPNKVDNSTNDAFPEVMDQGQIGACSSFATSYYQLSYMMNRAEGRSGKTKENVYSPAWAYNLVNGGTDSGSDVYENYTMLKEIGANNSVDVPFISSGTLPSNYLSDWHSYDSVWQKAQKNKISGFYVIPLDHDMVHQNTIVTGPKDNDLDQIKTRLSEGEILAIQTYVYDWNVHTIKASSQVNENNLHAGEPICDWVKAGTDGGHVMTVVGYNDDIWTDLNRDGQVQEGEKGAFKVVNSWGNNWNIKSNFDDPIAENWLSKDGFIWVAYDAINTVSSVQYNVYSYERQPFTVESEFYGIIPKPISEESKLYGRFTLNTTKRNTIEVTISATDSSEDDSNTNSNEQAFKPTLFTDWFDPQDSTFDNLGGSFTFTGTASADGTFYIDLDKVIKNIKVSDLYSNRWKLTLKDGVTDEVIASVKDFSIVDGINGKEYSANLSTPLYANGSEVSAYVNPVKIESPTNLTATKSSINTVNLNWTASANAASYKIYRDGSLLGETTTTSYVDKEVGQNATYKYEVKAKASDGSYSLRSKSSSVTTSNNKVILNYADTKAWGDVYVHYCVGNGVWTTTPGILMSTDLSTGLKQYVIDLGSSSSAQVCFNNGKGTWDNNGGKNYTLTAGNYSITSGVTTTINSTALKLDNFTVNVTEDSANQLYIDSLGNSFKLSTKASGGVGTIQYKYSFKKEGVTNVIRDYSNQNEVTWTPTQSGDYILYVEVKDISGQAIRKELNYSINANNLKIGNFIINSTTEDTTAPVQLIGKTIGGSGTIQYKYSVRNGTTTTVIQDYATTSTTSWTPTQAGDYTFIIEAIDGTGKTAKQEKIFKIYNPGPIIEDLKSSKGSPMLIGGYTTFSTVATRGKAPYKYQFTVNGQAITSYNNEASWKATEAGTYIVSVTVTDADGYSSTKNMKIGVFTSYTSDTVEETDPRIIYSGTWATSSNAEYSGGAVKYTSSTGSTASFKFTGTGVVLVGPKGTNRGIAKVTIDGIAYNVDMYNSSYVRTTNLFEKTDLDCGTHSITIAYTGTKNTNSTGNVVNFDKLNIIMGEALDYTNRVDETNSKITYSGTWSSTSNSGYIGGTTKYTSTVGAKATFTFTGTGISIIGAKSINRGIAKVTIDGVVYNSDMYNSVYSRIETLFEKKDLTSGTHTITIEYTGTKNSSSTGTIINIDAFDITNGNIV